MKSIFKSTCAAAAIAGATIMVPAVAAAGADVTVGIGAPDLVSASGAGYAPYDGQMYYDPIYISGAWYHGPYRWRMEGGERVFWVNGGWRRNEWRGGAIPGSLTFHNGGFYRGGRYDGFDDAERINARFRADAGAMSGQKPHVRLDRREMPQDRGNMQPDREDKPGAAQGGTSGRGRPDAPHN
jgi:hypothetical protein